MFGLEARHIEFIKDKLCQNIPNANYYIFGSRAKENFKKYSDIDIAIDNNGQILDAKILGKILLEFKDSTLPYEVDIVDLNSVGDKFKAIIKDSLIKI